MWRVRSVAFVTAFGFCLFGWAGQASRLPDVPQPKLDSLPSEVRSQVQKAYEAAREHPKNAGASGKLGMLLDLYDRPIEAVECYQRAHQLDPQSFRWLYYLGLLFAKEKRAREAAESFREALALNADYLPARLKLAESLFDEGDLRQSTAAYTAILRQYPRSAEAHYGLGRISAARGDYAAASEFFRKACELFPTYGPAHYALAIADRRLGKENEAQKELDLYAKNKSIVPPVDDPFLNKLRELDMSGASHMERGVQLEQVGRLDDAITETEKAVQLDPKLVKAHINLIILYGRIGNFQEAEQHYKAAVRLNSNQFPDAYYDYGVVLMKVGKFDSAEEAFRKALEIDPNYAAAHNDLGYLLERKGKLSDATGEYRKAVELEPDARQAHFNLGRLLVNQGQYQQAIEQLRQTLTPVDEQTPAYLYALGATYGRAGDRENALRYLREAREQASARGQTQLVTYIEKDLEELGTPSNSH